MNFKDLSFAEAVGGVIAFCIALILAISMWQHIIGLAPGLPFERPLLAISLGFLLAASAPEVFLFGTVIGWYFGERIADDRAEREHANRRWRSPRVR